MPQILSRKVQVTIEYDTYASVTSGELLDRITGPLEAVSRDLVKNLGSGVRGAAITYVSVGRPR